MRYSPIIQKTIEYIENSLQDELSLENIARFAGFSKFHYHRIFQKEVGVTYRNIFDIEELPMQLTCYFIQMKK